MDEIEFYYAPPGAKQFKYYNVFGPSVFMDANEPTDNWLFPGEVPGTRVHTSGKNIWGYKGKDDDCFLGEIGWFAGKMSIKDIVPAGRTYPPCCKTPPDDVCGGIGDCLSVFYFTARTGDCGCLNNFTTTLVRNDDGVWIGSAETGCPWNLVFEFSIEQTDDEHWKATLITDIVGECESTTVRTATGACPFFEAEFFTIPDALLGAECGCEGTIFQPPPTWLDVVVMKTECDFAHIASGGIRINSHADAVFVPPPSFTASGGIVMGGSAYASYLHHTSSGGIVINGAAGTPWEWDTSGTIIMGGTSDMYFAYFAADGVIIIDGAADYTVSYPPGSQGPFFAGTTDQGGASPGWANLTYITATDGQYATCTLPGGGDTATIKLSNFGFTVPSALTINGIEVKIIMKQDPTGTVFLDGLQFFLPPTTDSMDESGPTMLSTTDTTYTFGGSADAWGLMVTGADVNNTSFELDLIFTEVDGIDTTVYIDSVTVKVWYS